MFNPEQFEQKIYSLVTLEINKEFSKILKKGDEVMQTEGIKMQRQIMEILHYITEEIATQILYGLLVNKRKN